MGYRILLQDFTFIAHFSSFMFHFTVQSILKNGHQERHTTLMSTKNKKW